MIPNKTGTDETQIRCVFCARSPLLATFGLDRDRRPFVHVKVYKQKRIFGNVYVTGGPIHLQCRECLRWLKINFVRLHEVDLEAVETKDLPGTESCRPVPPMMDAERTR